MALKVLQGFKSIKIGAVGADGAMGTTLTEVLNIVADSVMIDIPESEPLEQYCEGTEAPAIVVAGRSAPKRIVFSTKELSAANLALFFGGTATGEVWAAPTESSNIYRSVEVVSKAYDGTKVTMEFPSVLMIAKGDLAMLDSKSGQIDANLMVTTPTNASGVALSPMEWTRA